MTPESDTVTPGHRQVGASLIDCLKCYFESQNAQPSNDEDTLGVSRNAASMFATSKSWVIDSSVVKFRRRLSSSGRIPRFQHSQTTPHSVLCQTSFCAPWLARSGATVSKIIKTKHERLRHVQSNELRSVAAPDDDDDDQEAPTGTNRHQQAPRGIMGFKNRLTFRHQWAPRGSPTGTNRHQRARNEPPNWFSRSTVWRLI